VPVDRPECTPNVYKELVGVNTNFFNFSVSAIVPGDLAKRGQDWILADASGTPSGGPATLQNGWPTQRSISRIIHRDYQRPFLNGVDPDDRLILSYDAQAAVPSGQVGVVPTDIVLIGDGIQQDGLTAVNGTRRTKYYRMEENPLTGLPQGFVTIFVKYASLPRVAAGTLDMDISVWVDQDHLDAYTANNEEVFFGQYVQRLQELNPGFIRTGTTWTNTSTASPPNETEAPGTPWEPDWSQRTLVTDPRWSVAEGVPWEVHAWLANKLQCNLWVCIPFQDDVPLQEAYVMGMAQLLMDELDPNLEIYVEYSNEMWNSNFTTKQYLEQEHPGDGDAQRQLAADLAEEAFRDWASVWNDCRVNFVAMGLTGDDRWTTVIATQLAAVNLCDAAGCTLYFAPNPMIDVPVLVAAIDPNTGDACEPDTALINSILTMRIDDTNANTGLTGAVALHAGLAASLGVEFFCYEGGPSLVPGLNPCLGDDYLDFHDTGEVGDLVTRILDRFVDPASTVIAPTVAQFGYFNFCNTKDEQNGSFYLLEDLWAEIDPTVSLVHTATQHKFLAVKNFNLAH
jgi:hypothetical protein